MKKFFLIAFILLIYSLLGCTEVIYYSIEFETNSTEQIDAVQIEAGTRLTPPMDPEKTYFRFLYWETEDGMLFDFQTPINNDLVLVAIYEPSVNLVTEVTVNNTEARFDISVNKALINGILDSVTVTIEMTSLINTVVSCGTSSYGESCVIAYRLVNISSDDTLYDSYYSIQVNTMMLNVILIEGKKFSRTISFSPLPIGGRISNELVMPKGLYQLEVKVLMASADYFETGIYILVDY